MRLSVCVCECIRWSISSKKQPASHTAHCVCLAAIAATTSCLLGKHTATRACKFLNRWIVFYFYFFRFCCLTTFIIYFLCFHFSLAFLVALWVLRFTIWHFCLAIPVPWSLWPSVSVSVSGTDWTFAMSAMCYVELCGDVLIDRSARDIHKLVIYCIWQHVCYVSAKIVAGHSQSCNCSCSCSCSLAVLPTCNLLASSLLLTFKC